MANLFSPINHFFSALRFITILPLGRSDRFEPVQMTAYFPVVGLFIGLMLAIVDSVAARFWSGPATALVDVIFLIIITGALHLDGVADTADGLYGRRSRDQALAIMKDSRIGPMGMLAVLCCLALKWAGIAGLQSDRILLLILIPAYARAAILLGMRSLPYARPEGGTGAAFFDQRLPMTAFWSIAVIGVLSIMLKWPALSLNIGFALLVGAVLGYYRMKMNGITGDMLGALIEMTESGLFFLLSSGVGR